MKEATSTSTSLKVVLAFTFLFAAFITVAIIYNRAFRVKNQSISILEKYEGISDNTLKILNTYLKTSGYDEMGTCESGYYGATNLNTTDLEKVSTSKKYYYCIKPICLGTNGKCNFASSGRVKYSFKVFFRFNLPFLGELATYKISGETKSIKLYNRGQVYINK